MARQEINIGVAPTGAGGDTTRSAAVKINAMTTELYARDAQLGTAANANLSTSQVDGTTGRVQKLGDWGVGTSIVPVADTVNLTYSGFSRWDTTTAFYSNYGALSGSIISVGFPGEACAQIFIGRSAKTLAGFRSGDGGFYTFYHTGNTTRGSGGALSAASPIVRIASVADSTRRDLQEQTFEPAGSWGVSNDQARGVLVERLDIGVYRVTGSQGLALEGWRTHDPSSPDGGRMLGITDSQQDDDGTVTVRLFKQRWTLTDDGEMVPGRGAPMDVPLNSWIDVRLEMPKAEAPPPIAATEE